MEIPWDTELVMLFRAVLAALLGGMIGWERVYRNKIDSEIRAFSVVSLGACTFGMISSIVYPIDVTRVAAGVVQGIGFLGAGVILRDGARIRGLATAATLWSTASVGLALAHGLYFLGITNALIIFLVRHLPDWGKIDSTYQNMEPEKLPPTDRNPLP